MVLVLISLLGIFFVVFGFYWQLFQKRNLQKQPEGFVFTIKNYTNSSKIYHFVLQSRIYISKTWLASVIIIGVLLLYTVVKTMWS